MLCKGDLAMKVELKVDGMKCGGCEKCLKEALSKVENVVEVEASFESGIVVINYENNIDLESIKALISDLDFSVVE